VPEAGDGGQPDLRTLGRQLYATSLIGVVIRSWGSSWSAARSRHRSPTSSSCAGPRYTMLGTPARPVPSRGLGTPAPSAMATPSVPPVEGSSPQRPLEDLRVRTGGDASPCSQTPATADADSAPKLLSDQLRAEAGHHKLLCPNAS
jgi:hypothetical protein